MSSNDFDGDIYTLLHTTANKPTTAFLLHPIFSHWFNTWADCYSRMQCLLFLRCAVRFIGRPTVATATK